MVEITRDLTPLLKKMEKEEAEDPRPWYVKSYPWFESEATVKVVSTEKGVFRRYLNTLTGITKAWMDRLQTLVSYLLTEKRLLITEVNEYYDKDTFARFRFCADDKGSIIEPISERLRKGDFTVIFIDMLTFNWGKFTLRKFETNLIHELGHVVDGASGLFVSAKDGLWHENEKEMKKWTREIIARYGSLASSQESNDPL